MSAVYNIAFMGKPKATLMEMLVELAKGDGVTIEAITLCEGSGAYNMGLMLPEENDKFVNALTMALMPAKWGRTSEDDPMIAKGVFRDDINRNPGIPNN